jgi:Flp pilus assembly protein TadG
MNAIRPVARLRGTREEREGGQILVIFALALIVIIGMVGLILDTGSAFAQRRGEQNAADLAAIAGANAYMNTTAPVAARVAAAQAAAILSASRNGYVDGVNGAVVPIPTVTLLQSGAHVRVSITAPHANTFSRVYGANSWDVSVEAAAVTGVVDTAVGAAPWTMSRLAFNADGSPKYHKNNPHDFGETNGDYPTSETDIAWTDFNGNNNANSNEIRTIIDGSNVVTATFTNGQYLGQHNDGNHTTLYQDVNHYMAGDTLPVPIVGPGPCKAPQQSNIGGCFVGWAMFYIISADGGTNKHIRGYFTDNFVQQPLNVGACPAVPTSPCGEIVAGSWDNLIVRLAPLDPPVS